MEVPKTMTRFCPHCKRHTEHSIRQEKASKKRRSLAWSERQKERLRRGYGNKGKFSKRPSGEKPTKKIDLRYKCKECGKEQVIGKGFRVKKFNIKK
jgi:large subunit ribosomal protein L44e